ncbi:MAG: acyl carrier protein [Paracoccaceae bacterium]
MTVQTWTTERVAEILRALAEEDELPQHLLKATISDGDTVETLGLDSIGAVALIDRLETEAGVALPDDFLDFKDTVADIAARLTAMG